MSEFDYNIQLDSQYTYGSYPPVVVANTSVTNISGATTVVTTINGGGGGQATGPTITFGSTWNGVDFTATQTAVNIEITNAANARTDLGAAASGINTDITQLNGASQVDVSGVYKVAGTQVVTSQQAAIPNAAGGVVIDVEARTALNTLLAELRTHGLIDT